MFWILCASSQGLADLNSHRLNIALSIKLLCFYEASMEYTDEFNTLRHLIGNESTDHCVKSKQLIYLLKDEYPILALIICDYLHTIYLGTLISAPRIPSLKKWLIENILSQKPKERLRELDKYIKMLSDVIQEDITNKYRWFFVLNQLNMLQLDTLHELSIIHDSYIIKSFVWPTKEEFKIKRSQFKSKINYNTLSTLQVDLIKKRDDVVYGLEQTTDIIKAKDIYEEIISSYWVEWVNFY